MDHGATSRIHKSMLTRTLIGLTAITSSVLVLSAGELSAAPPAGMASIKLIKTFAGELPAVVDSGSITGFVNKTPVGFLTIPADPHLYGELVNLAPGLITFGEGDARELLANYDSTADCQVFKDVVVLDAAGNPVLVDGQPVTVHVHQEGVPFTWSDLTHSGTITLPADSETICYITNTRKPADLTITKVATEKTVKPGETVHFTIAVANVGKSTAKNVLVGDPLVGTVGGCTVGGVAIANPAPTLAAGATMSCPVAYVVPPLYNQASLTNTATVASPSDATPPAPAVATVAITLPLPPVVLPPPPVDLTITKTLSTALAHNAPATWRIVVTNIGIGAQSGVIVTDSLPSNLSFASATGASWTCGAVAKLVTCTYTGTAAGGSTLAPIDLVTLVTAAAVPV
jgi:uncharacterized repeat protein (TIGR01451 family)